MQPFRIVLILGFLCFAMSCSESHKTKVIGHRGARGHIAENTLPSIEKALSLGADGIEVDVFVCASGELVVFHDQTLDRLTNASGRIESLSLDSILKIDVLNGFTIPTLNEVMDLIGGKAFLNIELKGTQTALPTHRLLEEYFKGEEWSTEKIVISSFNWEELEIFRNLNATVPIAILTEDDPLDALPIAMRIKAEAINPYYKALNVSNVKKIKEAGFELYPWTVNSPEDIAAMLSLKVDGIITDFPERIPNIH